MTLHYHGTPITPISALEQLAGCNFCVSYAKPQDVFRCHQIGQSVMLDNGAFTFWRQGQEATPEWWERYYEWADPWLDYQTTWAVIPDVIDGTEAENDHLIDQWPFDPQQSAPVWHMGESIPRLLLLAGYWPRVCIGSSGQYADLDSPSWRHRMDEAMNTLCGSGSPPVWLHMLRGMAQVRGPYPFASVDSVDVGRNHHRPQNTPVEMARRWDAIQTPARWTFRQQLEMEPAA